LFSGAAAGVVKARQSGRRLLRHPGEALEAFRAAEEVIGEQTAQSSAAVKNEPGQ
jgi:hypothetical protein